MVGGGLPHGKAGIAAGLQFFNSLAARHEFNSQETCRFISQGISHGRSRHTGTRRANGRHPFRLSPCGRQAPVPGNNEKANASLERNKHDGAAPAGGKDLSAM